MPLHAGAAKCRWCLAEMPAKEAVCSLQEIRDMCDLIFEKNTDYLGDYK